MTETLFYKLTVTFAAGMLLIALGCVARAETVSGQALANQIAGRTLIGEQMGMKVRLTFNADGTLDMNSPLFSGSGTWQVEGDQVCIDLPRRRPGAPRCQTFGHDGSGQVTSSTGTRFRLE